VKIKKDATRSATVHLDTALENSAKTLLL